MYIKITNTPSFLLEKSLPIKTIVLVEVQLEVLKLLEYCISPMFSSLASIDVVLPVDLSTVISEMQHNTDLLSPYFF